MAVPYYLAQNLSGECVFNKSALTTSEAMRRNRKQMDASRAAAKRMLDPELPDSQAPDSVFHLFPEFPSELRVKIWTFALSTPRVVEVMCKKESSVVGTRRVRHVKQFYSPTPAPAVLHACQESRFEALKHYDHCFAAPTSVTTISTLSTDEAAEYSRAVLTAPAAASVFVSLEQDTIRISESALRYLPEPELSSIRLLIIDVNDLAYFTHFNMGTMRACKSLEFLDIVVGEDERNSWSFRDGMFYEALINDFQQEEEAFPDWEMPEIRIHDSCSRQLSARKPRQQGWIRIQMLD